MEAGERYLHLKRGTIYTIVAVGLLQAATGSPVEGDRIVAYRSDDGAVWLRSEAEFLDGRFEHHPLETGDVWKWYHALAEDSETFKGPFETRDEAIEAGKDAWPDIVHGDGKEAGRQFVRFYVTEALKRPLRLADWIGAETIVERAEDAILDSDRVHYEIDDGPFFKSTADQERDLVERLKQACDAWQAAHGLVFHCRTFAGDRNGEYVRIDVTDERATAEDRASTS